MMNPSTSSRGGEKSWFSLSIITSWKERLAELVSKLSGGVIRIWASGFITLYYARSVFSLFKLYPFCFVFVSTSTAFFHLMSEHLFSLDGGHVRPDYFNVSGKN